MNVMLINTPSRKGGGGFLIPLGLLYVSGIVQRIGHNAKIVDLYLSDDHDESDSDKFEPIFRTIEKYKPSIIGYGGIATSYGIAKKLSGQIRVRYPEIFQIAGGALSSTYKLLLSKSDIDLVFHGETEISLAIFLSKFENGEPYYGVPGISYRYQGEILRNPPAIQVKDLDTIPLPPYDLIDVRTYSHNIEDVIMNQRVYMGSNSSFEENIAKIGTKKYYIPIVSGRGCTNRCLFCYRHVKGVRKHSVDYVIEHMKFLIDNYGIEGFQFVDELFNPTRKWISDFCNALKKENLDIFYLITGARVDKIDKNLLQQLKETGCIGITYGQESGSDTILRELQKGVSSQLNEEITIATKSLGLISPVQIVIGSPGETTNTILETINFLKEVGEYSWSVNYLIPLPETPIWQLVEDNHLIDDLEYYLDLVAEYGGTEPLINLTKCPDNEWRRWSTLMRKEIKPDYYKGRNTLYYYYLKCVYGLYYKILYFIHPISFKKLVATRLNKIICNMP